MTRLNISIVTLFIAVIFFAAGGSSANAESPTEQQKNLKAKSTKVIIKKGDTLTKIAKKHKTIYIRLFYANKKIKHPDIIYPGDKIRIPHSKEKLAKRPIPKTVATEENTTQATTPAPAYKAPNRVSYPAVSSGSAWDRLAACESGGNWAINTGNGYYGGLQFTLSTWRGVGGSGYPHQASKAEQIYRAQILQARSGWGQWPACSAKLGLY